MFVYLFCFFIFILHAISIQRGKKILSAEIFDSFSPLRSANRSVFISVNLLDETRVYRLPIVRPTKIDIPLIDFFLQIL